MFALIILSAYLLPLLYMVTTAFQQPGQASTPGAPVYPAAPLTAIFQGESYPIYAVPIDGVTRNLMLVVKGREDSTFVDPADPTATPIEWHGRWRTLTQAFTFAPRSRTSRRPGRSSNFPRLLFNTAAIACSARCCRRLVGARRLRLRAVPLPRPERPVHRPDRDDHPAVPGDPAADVRDLHEAGLERDVAAADRPAPVRQRLQRVPAAAVLHVDPARPRRSGDDRWRGPVPDPSVGHPADVRSGHPRRHPLPLLLRLERLLRPAAVPRRKA